VFGYHKLWFLRKQASIYYPQHTNRNDHFYQSNKQMHSKNRINAISVYIYKCNDVFIMNYVYITFYPTRIFKYQRYIYKR